MNNQSRSNFFAVPITVLFNPLLTLLAVLIPMYTVTSIVNKYPFWNPHFSLYEWHGFQMIFGFFYTFTLVYALNFHRDTHNRPNYLPLIFVWILDQVGLFIIGDYRFFLVTSSLLAIIGLSHLFKANVHRPIKNISIALFGSLSLLKILFISLSVSGRFPQKFAIYDTAALLLVALFFLIAHEMLPKIIHKEQREFDATLPKPILIIMLITFIFAILSQWIGIDFLPYAAYVGAGVSSFFLPFYWDFKNSLKSPLISFFHIGFLVLSFSLFLKGISFFAPVLDMNRANLHLVLAGGLSIIVLNTMVRTLYLESRRKLKMNKLIWTMQTCLIVGFLIRVFVPIISPDHFLTSLHYAMGFWSLAFLIFLIKLIVFYKPKNSIV